MSDVEIRMSDASVEECEAVIHAAFCRLADLTDRPIDELAAGFLAALMLQREKRKDEAQWN